MSANTPPATTDGDVLPYRFDAYTAFLGVPGILNGDEQHDIRVWRALDLALDAMYVPRSHRPVPTTRLRMWWRAAMSERAPREMGAIIAVLMGTIWLPSMIVMSVTAQTSLAWVVTAGICGALNLPSPLVAVIRWMVRRNQRT